MNEEVKKDILDVLRETIEAFSNKNETRLRELSNHTIHNSSIYQDKDSINVAVLVYSLAKLLNRQHHDEELIHRLISAKECLEHEKIEEYEKELSIIFDIISDHDKKINFYVKHIINQAGIKKGSKIYEHGISLARAAEILNISQWELMKYLGQTNISDKQEELGVSLKERLDYTRELFGIK